MSAVLSPSYANVFMGNLEEKMLNSARVKPKYYKRVVDNIFMIIDYTEMELCRTAHTIHVQLESIETVHTQIRQEGDNLPGHDSVQEPQKKWVRTFIKFTNKQLYIRKTSHHPSGATEEWHSVKPSDVSEQTPIRDNFTKWYSSTRGIYWNMDIPEILSTKQWKKWNSQWEQNQRVEKTQLKVTSERSVDQHSSPDTIQEQEKYSE